ncbi:FixH family protein [Flavobacteriaceae bacterium]|nr:FixH family protein [Flavobacteriaceae bacterium]
MKWNWGSGIVLAMLGFIGFILYFVITMSTDEKYSHDLVTEDYYAKEMAYQNEIDAEKNTHNLVEKIESKKVLDGWLITFPTEFDTSKIMGTIALYRPSNQQLDFEAPLVFTDHQVHIPDKNLIDGRWNITMEWTYQDKVYMYKEKIVY